MKRMMIGALVLGSLAAACSRGGISQDTYVAVMTDLGCHLTLETDQKAKAIFEKHGVTQNDIDAFRTTAREEVLTAATKIADNVAQCLSPK